MRYKQGVKLNGIKPEIAAILPVIWYAFAPQEVVITDIMNFGKTRKGKWSLHSVGYAIDLRTRHLAHGVAEKIVATLNKNLTDEFDVVLKLTPPHIHIEFQPKT